MKRLLCASLVSLVSLSGSVASAQTVTGCLSPKGDLEKVAVGNAPLEDCKTDETQVTLGDQGPQGQQGPQGEQGPPGDPAEQLFVLGVGSVLSTRISQIEV